MNRRLALLVCISAISLGLLPGCTGSIGASASDSDVFYTATTSILPGEDIGLRLVNRTDLSLRYNLCRSTVQRQTSTGWQSVDLTRRCPDVRFRLAPTETAAFDLETPRSLPPGTYRVVTPVSYEDRDMEMLRTQAFRVTSEPSVSRRTTNGRRSALAPR